VVIPTTQGASAVAQTRNGLMKKISSSRPFKSSSGELDAVGFSARGRFIPNNSMRGKLITDSALRPRGGILWDRFDCSISTPATPQQQQQPLADRFEATPLRVVSAGVFVSGSEEEESPLPILEGQPGEPEFDLTFTMITMYCGQHFQRVKGESSSEAAKAKKRKLDALENLRDVLGNCRQERLDKTHQEDLLKMISEILLRRLWRPDAKVKWLDLSTDIEDEDFDLIEVTYEILTIYEQIFERVPCNFVLNLCENLTSCEPRERPLIGAFIHRAFIGEKEKDRNRVLQHCLMMMDEMTEEVIAGPELAGVIALVRVIISRQGERVSDLVTRNHIIPLLRNRGLPHFWRELGRWVNEASLDPGFRNSIIKELVFCFPLGRVAKARIYLEMLKSLLQRPGQLSEHVASRLLATIGRCIGAEDQVSFAALELAESGVLDEVFRAAPAGALSGMLEAVSMTACDDNAGKFQQAAAAQFIRRIGLVCRVHACDFICQFHDHDRTAVSRAGWVKVAQMAGDRAFNAEALKRNSAVIKLREGDSSSSRRR
jgi:hypothetical protein